MPKAKYSARFIFDKSFLLWVQSLGPEYSKVKYDVLKFMSIIHKTSEDNPKMHNLIHFGQYPNLMISISPNELLLLLQPVFSSAELPADDQITKIVKLAIATTNEKPYKAIIFTDNPTKALYLSNSHLQSVKDVELLSEVDGLNKILHIFKTEYEARK